MKVCDNCKKEEGCKIRQQVYMNGMNSCSEWQEPKILVGIPCDDGGEMMTKHYFRCTFGGKTYVRAYTLMEVKKLLKAGVWEKVEMIF